MEAQVPPPELAVAYDEAHQRIRRSFFQGCLELADDGKTFQVVEEAVEALRLEYQKILGEQPVDAPVFGIEDIDAIIRGLRSFHGREATPLDREILSQVQESPLRADDLPSPEATCIS